MYFSGSWVASPRRVPQYNAHMNFIWPLIPSKGAPAALQPGGTKHLRVQPGTLLLN